MKDRLLAWWGQHHARTVEVDGVPIYVPAGVLDPVLFRTGAWFARVVAERVNPGTRLLDLGCGSGVVGVLAQRAGAQVVAADVDLHACAAARANGIETVYDGDLFDALPSDDAPYDLVCFNPPYLPNPNNRHAWARALYDEPALPITRRFVAEVREHLNPGGQALVAWSGLAPAAEPHLGEEFHCLHHSRIQGESLELWGSKPDQPGAT